MRLPLPVAILTLEPCKVDLTSTPLEKGDYAMQEEPEYRYAIELFWSEEDDCFVACVPDLENCAAWGMSYEQALAQAHLAIQIGRAHV